MSGARKRPWSSRTSCDRHDDRARPFPLFRSLAGYDRRWLRSDLTAGLTVWAVLVPEAPAYATIAGVSPVVAIAFIDVTELRMLDELAADPAHDHQQLVIAHDLGQVRDLLAQGGTSSAQRVYPTIDDAVAAVTAADRESAAPGS